MKKISDRTVIGRYTFKCTSCSWKTNNPYLVLVAVDGYNCPKCGNKCSFEKCK